MCQVLLWPWPEFSEPQAQAGAIDARCWLLVPCEVRAEELEKHPLEETLKEMAAPGVAKHAAKLKKAGIICELLRVCFLFFIDPFCLLLHSLSREVWPQWSKVAEGPALGLVFRECLLPLDRRHSKEQLRLSFLHAACALAQLSSKPVYDIWVVPPLRNLLSET